MSILRGCRQAVRHHLPKVVFVGSNPITRSFILIPDLTNIIWRENCTSWAESIPIFLLIYVYLLLVISNIVSLFFVIYARINLS